jgi:hypothetical protein
MAGVQELEQIEGLATANLAEQNAVGPVPEACFQ